MTPDLVVVGAGISGLALAREFRAGGGRVLVLERARGVGGRCATRRVDGQPVDHGTAFLHGRDPAFLAELGAAAGPAASPDWPHVLAGPGTPCRPAAFEAGSVRLAPAAGVSAFPKHLARGLDVRLGANVESLRVSRAGGGAAGNWELALSTGETLRSPAVALTLPAPSAAAMLEHVPGRPAGLAALLPLCRLVRTLPCLTVIARYPEATPPPGWDVVLPGSGILHTLVHDSAKRGPGARLVLVLQANPRYSREHLDSPKDSWSRALLEEAAAGSGAWIALPEDTQAHTWEQARVSEGSELARPVVAELEGGARLGLCGDGFHPAGGVEGAWHSGRALAARFLDRMRRAG